jgi:hypothetical protein
MNILETILQNLKEEGCRQVTVSLHFLRDYFDGNIIKLQKWAEINGL